MNTIELNVEMLRHGDKGETLANALGIARATLSAKLNGKAEFTHDEMVKIRNRYELDADRFVEIFFPENLS